MSTRGAVGFKLDGKYKVAYNHFDSYPSFLGAQVLDFCESMANPGCKRQLVHQVAGLKETNVRKETAEGIDFLWGTFDGSVREFQQYFSFISDGLFCEYAYIIDLDEMELKFYRGCRDKAGESDLPFPMVPDGSGYYPCHLKFSLPFDNLPSSWKIAYERDFGNSYGRLFPEFA
jgi:hypothetical protein